MIAEQEDIWTAAFYEWYPKKPKGNGHLGVFGREWREDSQKKLEAWIAACKFMEEQKNKKQNID